MRIPVRLRVSSLLNLAYFTYPSLKGTDCNRDRSDDLFHAMEVEKI